MLFHITFSATVILHHWYTLFRSPTSSWQNFSSAHIHMVLGMRKNGADEKYVTWLCFNVFFIPLSSLATIYAKQVSFPNTIITQTFVDRSENRIEQQQSSKTLLLFHSLITSCCVVHAERKCSKTFIIQCIINNVMWSSKGSFFLLIVLYEPSVPSHRDRDLFRVKSWCCAIAGEKWNI